MSGSDGAAPPVSIGTRGLDPGEALARLARIHAAAVAAPERLVAVDAYALRIPLEQGAEDEALFDAYRRMLRLWNVAESPPIASHRRLVGPLVVRAKKLTRRIVAFELDPFFERQTSFNRAVLDLVRVLIADLGRLRERVRELEADAAAGAPRPGAEPERR
ncbi:MAG: hypothetical protein U0610_12760 [bacterium]